MWDLLFDGVEISAGESKTSHAIHLWDGKNDHAFEYTITGDGTASVTVYTSISGREWISNGVKASGIGKTSGPGSDGKDNIPVSLRPSELLKIMVTETGEAESVTISLWFAQK